MLLHQSRAQHLSRRNMSGIAPKENRGGDRRAQKYGLLRQCVKSHIENLKYVESHYTREKSTRLYMSSDFNVRKL